MSYALSHLENMSAQTWSGWRHGSGPVWSGPGPRSLSENRPGVRWRVAGAIWRASEEGRVGAYLLA